MARDQNTAKWMATITVDLQPVNQYGDKLDTSGAFSYQIAIPETSLVDVVKRLEGLKERSA